MNEFIGVHGMPTLATPIYNNQPPPKPAKPDNKVAVNYYGDHGGCGWWRMLMPETLINYSKKGNIMGMTKLIPHEKFYSDVSTIRLQRQASKEHLEFLTHLKTIADKHEIKLIYEIDDVILQGDMPEFNVARKAYMSDEVFESTIEMMKMCDVMTVSCNYLRDYFVDKINHNNIQVIPNRPARMWFDGYYSPGRIMSNYHANVKRPKILYAGSGNHFNIKRISGIKDDFSHVLDAVIKTRREFEWVFMGPYPPELKPYIDNGQMTLIDWAPIYDYPRMLSLLDINAVYAPLMDCTFNRAKSNIKYLESACIGIPGVFQDMITYKEAPLRFTTGDDLIDQLRKLLTNKQYYAKMSKRCRDYANTMWLDDNMDVYEELYFGNS